MHLWEPVALDWDRELLVACTVLRGMVDSLPPSSCSCTRPAYCSPAHAAV